MEKPGSIIVTGARGQLGVDLVSTLGKNREVLGIDIDELDIRDEAAVGGLFTRVGPSVVVHSAAFTDVDGCESNHEAAFAVNRDGTRNVAKACRDIGARMFYISTDYVFDGEKNEPYHEDDPTHPNTVYGMSKLAGEKAVWEELEDFVILRIAWLYGRHGKNFVRTMLKLAQQQTEGVKQGQVIEPLKVVDDQIGNPTWTMEVVRQIEELLDSDITGVCHSTCEGEATWYRFACDIFDIMNFKVQVRPCTTAEFPRPAPRPRRSTLANERLTAAGINVMRNYRVALEDFLQTG